MPKKESTIIQGKLMYNKQEKKNLKDAINHLCIFENKYCRYACKQGNSFECKCPTDAEMPCSK